MLSKKLLGILTLTLAFSLFAAVFVFAQQPETGRTPANEKAVYIVQLQDAPVAVYRGGVEGYPATSAAVTGRAKFDAESADALAYRAYLAKQRAAAVNSISSSIGRAVDLGFVYDTALNGFSVELTAGEAAKIAALPEVKYIEKDREYELHTDHGPAWIGADEPVELYRFKVEKFV